MAGNSTFVLCPDGTTLLIDAANRIVNNQFISKLKSLEGHIVVRVAPGGREFRVVICDNEDDSNRVKSVFGPY